jgi:mannose-6-phosphate isomerase-like protein (cupin superfamily)
MDRRETLLGLFALAAAANGAAADGLSGSWPEAVFTLEKSKTEKHPFGEVTIYHEAKTEQLKSLVVGSLLLYPGQEPHPPHQHPEEEIMIVTEGHGNILVGGKDQKVGPGAMMYSESNKLHGVKNTGSAPLRFYYMKWLA